ncbi:MAG TPA: hypothetical protein DDZ51_00410 [Planctomycetaceae bacterium]|nr:hypothetical protein [Planctomycetaceae bacterium]
MLPLLDRDACTRCGACFVADTHRQLSKDSLGFPVYDPKQNIDTQKLLSVCTGENWNYRQLLKEEYGDNVQYDPSTPDIGHHRTIYLVASSDSKHRLLGQSGGVTTTILRHGFETGYIDATLAVRRPKANVGSPYASEPFIATNTEELLDSCGSKYTICSTLELLGEIASRSSKFALTSLPCQTVGLKRLVQAHDSTLRDKCKLIIGPFCGLNMEAEAGLALAKATGIEPANVVEFRNRGGEFPGVTIFKNAHGADHFVDRTAHRMLYRMYSPLRCYTCTDYGNELADLSVADCWLSEKGEFKFPEGAAYVICRTERGEKLLREVISSGKLISYDFNENVAKRNWRDSFLHRKVRAHNRIRYWAKRGKLVPKPDYPMPAEFTDSKIADFIEIAFWRFFRWRFARTVTLKLWFRLSNAPERTIRNLLFQDCKRYLFTHTFDHFNRDNFTNSAWQYYRAFSSQAKSFRLLLRSLVPNTLVRAAKKVRTAVRHCLTGR